jgi:hypothetical protein
MKHFVPISMKWEMGNLNDEQQLVIEVKKATILRLPEENYVSKFFAFSLK